ncbi:hypothetical protein, partial [Vibrio coralliilyticus]|uniref:hypothetical protein n=1 Tax=Vibrio coralliilyticus TaxID=190893 RepID=UPI001C52FB90
VTPGVAGSSPVRSATYLEKALTAMLGLFRICSIIFGLEANESSLSENPDSVITYTVSPPSVTY